MTLLEILIIFFAIIGTYAALVYILHKKKILQKYNISFYGPMLMWRTKKGILLLKRIARRRHFWKSFGNAGIIFCFLTMILMTILIILMSWAYLGLTPEQTEMMPGIETALVIPVINPILPIEYLGYIILALVVAMVTHEFSHGILAFASNLKVKSLGILYLIVPLGAFCEPDEEDLQTTKSSNRMRIFAAGPLMNFVVVLISVLLISIVFMSAVQPIEKGVDIIYKAQGSPADQYDLPKGAIITYYNNTRINNLYDYLNVSRNTQSNQSVNVTYVIGSKTYQKEVILANLYDYTKNTSDNGTGYLGIQFSALYGKYLISSQFSLDIIKNPLSIFPDGFLYFYSIPILGYFQGYNPIVQPFTESYKITGPLSILPTNLFWIIVNALYWIFWLNFAVALFNVLPAVPLDGGFLFKDGMNMLVKRIKKGLSDEQREKIINRISLTLSLTIFFLVFLPFIIKYFYALVKYISG